MIPMILMAVMMTSSSMMIERIAVQEFGPSAPMFLCVLHVESGKRHGVTGDGGRAYGIGQLHEDALVDACLYLKRKRCDPKTLITLAMTDRKESIKLSAAYLRLMVDTFGGDWRKGIMAYHLGPYALQRERYDWDYYGKVIACLRPQGH